MEDFVTKREFLKLEGEVKTMSHNVNTLSNTVNTLSSTVGSHVTTIEGYIKKFDGYHDRLIDVLTKTVPQGHIPIETHHKIIKSLIWAFTVVIFVSVSAVKLVPALLEKL